MDVEGSGWAHNNAIGMIPLVVGEFLPSAETRRTYIYAVARFTNRVCTFDADGMSQITRARITLELDARLMDVWGR